MGGGTSKLDSKALHENLEKFSPEKMRIFRKMHLSNEVLNALWKTFIAIATIDEGSGKENKGRSYEDHEISYKEFHDYYDLGTNHFSKIVFNRMDYGESGEINFEEYVFSLWDFLTNDLHHFVFQVFDKDDSNYLNHKDMEQLMLCSYGVQFDEHHNAKADQMTQKLLRKTAMNAVNIADRNNDKKITFDEYEFFTRKNGIVEHPGHDMQEKLCKANGGGRMWAVLRKHRVENHQTNSLHKVLQHHAWTGRDKSIRHQKKKKHHHKKEDPSAPPEEGTHKHKALKKKKTMSDEEAAATKIQAAHRGKTSRKHTKGKGHHHGKNK